MNNNATNSKKSAKREGYIQGRNDENYVQRVLRGRRRVVAETQVAESTGRGVIFGLSIAFLAALLGGLFFIATSDDGDVVPVAVPQVEQGIDLPDVEVTVPDVEIKN